jgi:hypothetical protein
MLWHHFFIPDLAGKVVAEKQGTRHTHCTNLQEIQERLNLPDDDVTRLLHSLACAKYKILSKDADPKTIAKGDKFRCVGLWERMPTSTSKSNY